MRIIIDSREHKNATILIENEFIKRDVNYIRSKLPFGDYYNPENPNLVIDRKKSLAELCVNLSDVPMKDKNGHIRRDKNGKVMTDKKRFIAELDGARQFGQHLVILIEHGAGIKCLEDIKNWKNPRLRTSPLAMSGERLYTILSVMKRTYGFDVEFCDKKDTGKRIIEILERQYEGDNTD